MDPQIDHQRPIPAFYCCYLLRSTVRHASLYIGSTPNPGRRLSQHNGISKGGAKRTAAERLRPWEMVVIVEGFMSRIGALQFEWAWQHGKESRHIESDKVSSKSTETNHVNIDPKTGKAKARKRRSQTRKSLTTQLADVHRLLRSTYFSHWPLTIRFFAADVHRVWKTWSERVDGGLPSNIRVVLDGDCTDGISQLGRDDARVGSIHQLQVSYSGLQDYLEKSMFLLDDPQDLCCRVCEKHVLPENELAVVCPQKSCHCTSHLICLSKFFLNTAAEPDRLVPTQGSCPACKEVVEWPLMMKELSLRVYGGKESQALLKKKKNRSKVDGRASAPPSSKEKDVDSSNQNKKGHRSERSTSVTSAAESYSDPTINDVALDYFDLEDDWMEGLDFGSDSDTGHGNKKPLKRPPPKLEIVIEDSEDDEAGVLD